MYVLVVSVIALYVAFTFIAIARLQFFRVTSVYFCNRNGCYKIHPIRPQRDMIKTLYNIYR
ncbi:hypothetical protein [Escherichia phage vB_EcoS_ULIM2]|nr:hypothetical protein [Escherichia phage vB_EcoS_ULIM2]